eukprot:scaffold59015_cov31-Tisochrysis_lutea.AAC.5
MTHCSPTTSATTTHNGGLTQGPSSHTESLRAEPLQRHDMASCASTRHRPGRSTRPTSPSIQRCAAKSAQLCGTRLPTRLRHLRAQRA